MIEERIMRLISSLVEDTRTSDLVMWLITPINLVDTLEEIGAVERIPAVPVSPTREQTEQRRKIITLAITRVAAELDDRVPRPREGRL